MFTLVLKGEGVDEGGGEDTPSTSLNDQKYWRLVQCICSAVVDYSLF